MERVKTPEWWCPRWTLQEECGVSFEGFTITNTVGSAVHVRDGRPAIRTCIFTGNGEECSGAIVDVAPFEESTARLNLEGCSFDNNTGVLIRIQASYLDLASSAMPLFAFESSEQVSIAGCIFTGNESFGATCLQGLSELHVIDNCFTSGNIGVLGNVINGSGFLLRDSVIEECCAIYRPPFGGTAYVDGGGNTVGSQTCRACDADVSCDGYVDSEDLGLLLAAFDTENERFDFDGDGVVNGSDLGLLLQLWGACE